MKLLAYYLPQFYPIPENDIWWESGFTEWTNVTKAKPLFEGHNQPRFPADLGYYDLRVAETRISQADLAKAYGIHGFCYYNYWFGGGRTILNRVAEEVLLSQTPDFPFCFCWANESWKGVWHGLEEQKVLIEQTYPGEEDFEDYFYYLLRFFKDDRYIKVSGKPVFQVYKVTELPDLPLFVSTFRELAIKAGFPGIYLIAGIPPTELHWNPLQHGFDAVIGSEFSALRFWKRNVIRPLNQPILHYWDRFKSKFFPESKDFSLRTSPVVIEYEFAIEELITEERFTYPYFPVLIHDWDNSPRSTSRSLILNNSTPELFRRHLKKGIDKVKNLPEEERFVLLKSWNEWGEGNALEPDKKWGHSYLQVIKEELGKF
jgi:hypothetical protein